MLLSNYDLLRHSTSSKLKAIEALAVFASFAMIDFNTGGKS
jgi:hypothetical protein